MSLPTSPARHQVLPDTSAMADRLPSQPAFPAAAAAAAADDDAVAASNMQTSGSTARPPSPVNHRRRSKSPPSSSKLKPKTKSRSRSPSGVGKRSPMRSGSSGNGFMSRSRRAMVAAWVRMTRLGGSLFGGSSSGTLASTSRTASTAVQTADPMAQEVVGSATPEQLQDAGIANAPAACVIIDGHETNPVASFEETGDVATRREGPGSTVQEPGADDNVPMVDTTPSSASPAAVTMSAHEFTDAIPSPTTLLDVLHIDPIWHRLALTYLPPRTVTRLRRVCRYLHDLIDHGLPVTHWLPTPTLRQCMLHGLAAAGYTETVLLARLVPRTPEGILARPSRQAWPALAAAVRGKHARTVETLLKLEPRRGAVGQLLSPPPRALTSKGLHRVSLVADAAARSDAATLRVLLTGPGTGGSHADHWIPVPAAGRVLKSALMCAIEAGNVATAQVLRELGARWAPRARGHPRVDRQRETDSLEEDDLQHLEMGAVCIGLAILSGSVNMLKWVLAHVPKDAIRTRPPWAYRMALLENLTPLMLAVTSDSLDMVQVMLAAGAPVVMLEDLEDRATVPSASALGGEKVRKALQALPSWVFSNPLDLATTKKSRAPVFKLLVEAHRNQACGNVMHQCSFYQSDFKLAAALTATPSKMDAARSTVAPPMHESFLACAVRRGNVVLVKAALDMGAQVSVPGRPWVKPPVGSELEHCPIAGYRYAPLDDCDAMGYFLLCLAVKGGHDEVASVLREHLDQVSGGVAKIPWNMDVPEVIPPSALSTGADGVEATTTTPSPDGPSVPTPAPEESNPEAAAAQQQQGDTNDASATPSPSASNAPARGAPMPAPSSPLHGEPLYGKTPLHLALERPVGQWEHAGIDRMLDEGAWMHVLDDQGYAPLDIALRGAGVNHPIVQRMVAMLCASPDKVVAGFATLSVLIHAAVIAASRGEAKEDDLNILTGLLAARPVECKDEQGKLEDGQLADVRKRFGGVSQVAGMIDAGLLPVDVELQNFPMYLEKAPFSPIPLLMDPVSTDAESEGNKSTPEAQAEEKKPDGSDKSDDDEDDTSSLCSGCGRRHGKEKKDKDKTPKTPDTDLDLSQAFYAGLATPLFRAVVARNMHLVRLLLKHGAHPNVGLEHAHLSWAAQRNHVSSTIRSPLAQAVYMGDLNMVRELLAHGAAMREGEYDLTQCSVSSTHEKNSTCRVTVLMIALYLRAVARDLEESIAATVVDDDGDQKDSMSSGPSTPSRSSTSKSPLLLAANQPPPAVLPPLPSVVRTPSVFSVPAASEPNANEASGTTFTFTPSTPGKSVSFSPAPVKPSTPTPTTPGASSSHFLTPASLLGGTSPLASTPVTPPATSAISLVAPPASAIPRLKDAIKRYNLTVTQLDAVIAELRARNAPITWTRLPCPRLCRKSEQFRLVRGDDLNDTVKCADECMRHTTEMSLAEKLKAGAAVEGGKRAKARHRKVSTGRTRVSALPGPASGSKSPATLPLMGSTADEVPPVAAENGVTLPLLTSAAVASNAPPFAFSFSWASAPGTEASSSGASAAPAAAAATASSLFTFGGSSAFSFKYTPLAAPVDGATIPLPASPVLGVAPTGSPSPSLMAVLDVPLPPSPLLGALEGI